MSIDHPVDLRSTITNAVLDVFSTMLSSDLKILDAHLEVSLGDERVVGAVGFAGDVSGVVCIHVTEPYARQMTASILGTSPAEIKNDEEINDAIGEVTNIIAGKVKSRLCDAGSMCALSLPSIVRGNHVEIESITESKQEHFLFAHQDQNIVVELYIRSEFASSNGPTSHKILLVDDSKIIRMILAKAFRPFDCQIFEAANGVEALEIAKREHPHLIILDLTMPVMDGGEVLTQVKKDEALRTIPVLMLTANAGKDDIQKLMEMGACDYLTKSFDPEDLIARTKRVLDLKPK